LEVESEIISKLRFKKKILPPSFCFILEMDEQMLEMNAFYWRLPLGSDHLKSRYNFCAFVFKILLFFFRELSATGD